MNREASPPVLRAFYRKLLRFYPRPFRERFGESMEQTFDDLCREQEGRPERLLSLTVRLSVDTGLGIVREQVLFFSQRGTMRELLRNRILAAVIGLLFFLPGAAIFLLLLFGNEPPVGQFSLFGVTPPNGPLSGYLQPSGDGPHIVGSLIALGLMFVLPAIGVLINVAASEGNVLKNLARDLGIAAIVGAVLTLPLAVLELTLAKVSISNLPFPLFAILWLLPTTFLVVLAPIVRSVRLGKGLFANPIALAFRLGFLVLIALFWTGLMSDQLPCFLGVPNCD